MVLHERAPDIRRPEALRTKAGLPEPAGQPLRHELHGRALALFARREEGHTGLAQSLDHLAAALGTVAVDVACAEALQDGALTCCQCHGNLLRGHVVVAVVVFAAIAARCLRTCAMPRFEK